VTDTALTIVAVVAGVVGLALIVAFLFSRE
jgi:hypothetical protein